MIRTFNRYFAQSLRRFMIEPGFMGAATGILALAIAAAATMFAALDAVLLRDLPYAEADRLALVWQRTDADRSDRIRLPAPDVDILERFTTSFAGLAFVTDASDGVIEYDGRPDHVRIGDVSGNFFAVLGVPPMEGRTFREGEAMLSGGVQDTDAGPASPGVVVLTDRFWASRFGRDPSVIGATIRIDASDYLVTGVMPASFAVRLPAGVGIDTDVDIWRALRTPLGLMQRADGLRDQDSDNTGAVIARLGQGASFERAGQELEAVAQRLRDAVPAYDRAGMRLALVPMKKDITEQARPAMLAVAAAVLLILLVACLNVAGLQVARAARRRREMAVRSALGASPASLGGLIMGESAILAGAAGIVGLVLAQWSIELLRTTAPAGMAGIDAVSLSTGVILFTAVATLFAALVAGTASTFAVRRDGDIDALRGRGPETPGRSFLRQGLIVGQVCVSIVLLVSAGLLLRSFSSLARVNTGFDADQLVTFNIALPGQTIGGPGQRSAFMRTLADRIAESPGIRAVGLIGGLPLSGERFTQPFGLEGEPVDAWSQRQANFRVISSDYFSAIGTRLVAGRAFTRDEDLGEDARVAIVDRQLADLLAPGGSAVGRFVQFPLDGQPVRALVVGVAEDVRFDDLRSTGLPTLYVPYRQEASRQVGFAVRTTGQAAAMEAAIRSALSSMDGAADVPVWDFRPMRDFVDAETAPTRFALVVTGVFAAVALLLAMLSLYSLIAWLAAERRAEIGIRMVLGAQPGDVTRQYTLTGVRLTAIGLGCGLLLSAMLSLGLSGLLFATARLDPAVYLGVALLIASTATLASLVPARAAAAADPAAVLGGRQP